MPLSQPALREHIHTRRIECRGYRRADGLWDIEGHLTDVKSYSFSSGFRSNDFRGQIEPDEPLHDMWLRLTVDDHFVIVGAEASTDKAPFRVCPEITPAFGKLIGLHIGPGFTRKVRHLLGGVHGCTHLVELVNPVATTAFQTIYPILAQERAARTDGSGVPNPHHPPPLLNTCHAFASDGEIVRRHLPAFYTGSEAAE